MSRELDATPSGDLIAAHWAAVHRTIRHLVHDPDVASDLAQATFVRAANARAGHRGTGSLRGWLLAIAVNEVRQHKRAERRRREIKLPEALDLRVDPRGDASDAAVRREFEALLARELARIPDDLQEPVVLRYFEDLSIGAIADVLDLPKSTVQTRLERALDRLRVAFARSGHAALLAPLDRLVTPAPTAAAPLATTAAMTKSKGIAAAAALVALAALVPFVVLPEVAGGTPEPGASDSPSVRADGVGSGHGHDGEARGDTASAMSRHTVEPTTVPDRLVFGRVVSSGDGAPLAGAALSLFDYENDTIVTVTADDEGRFAFDSTRDRDGVFWLVADEPNAGRATLPDVRATAIPLRVAIEPGLEIAGAVVRAADGTPVRRFEIQAVKLPFAGEDDFDAIEALERQAVPQGLRIARERAVDDPEGRFRLRGLEAGEYALLVHAEGGPPLYFNDSYQPRNAFHGIAARPEAAVEPVRIELPAVAKARVRVVDAETHVTIAGARLLSGVSVGREHFWRPAATRMSSDGTYEAALFWSAAKRYGELDLEVRCDGYAPSRVRARFASDGEPTVVAMRRPALVHGATCNADGSPVAGAAVLFEHAIDESLVASTSTSSDGSFEVRDLPAGLPLAVRCLDRSRTRILGTAAMTLEPLEVRRLEFGSGSSGRIDGVVRVRGEPSPRTRVRLRASDGRTLDCDTGPDGAFGFDDLQPGRFRIQVVPAALGGEVVEEAELQLAKGEARTVDLDFSHRVRGRAIDHATGDPIRVGETVPIAVRAPDASLPHSTTTASIRVDGTFELWLPRAGRHSIELGSRADVWQAAPCDFEVVAGGPDPEPVLRLSPDRRDRTIRTRFVDAKSGEPVASGTFRFLSPRSGTAGSFDGGEATFDELSPGRYRLFARSDAHVEGELVVELGPADDVVERTLALRPSKGVRIDRVQAGSPAALAGLETGDLVERVGEKAVSSIAELRRALREHDGDEGCEVVVRRDGLPMTLRVESTPWGVEITNVADP